MKEAILLTDGYKLNHRRQYPEGTEYVYSNWTPRSCYYYPEASEGAVVFGIQYFIKEYLMKQFQQDFFDKPKDVVVYKKELIRHARKTGFKDVDLNFLIDYLNESPFLIGECPEKDVICTKVRVTRRCTSPIPTSIGIMKYCQTM